MVVMSSFMLHQYIRLYFKSNKRFIAAHLCEKRKEPINTCKGQCHLKKMSQKAKDTSAKVYRSIKLDFICEYPIDIVLHAAPVLFAERYCDNIVPTVLLGFYTCVEDPPDLGC